MRFTDAMTSWFRTRFRRIRVAKLFGRIRISTVALIAAFSVLFWVYQTFEPERAAELPAPAVVPPGFVPDPNYTWVPRTNVRTSQPDATTTTTPTSPTETTSPGETTTPTSPSESTPTSPTTTAESPERPETPTPQTPTTPAPNTTTAGPVERTTGPAR